MSPSLSLSLSFSRALLARAGFADAKASRQSKCERLLLEISECRIYCNCSFIQTAIKYDKRCRSVRVRVMVMETVTCIDSFENYNLIVSTVVAIKNLNNKSIFLDSEIKNFFKISV